MYKFKRHCYIGKRKTKRKLMSFAKFEQKKEMSEDFIQNRLMRMAKMIVPNINKQSGTGESLR